MLGLPPEPDDNCPDNEPPEDGQGDVGRVGIQEEHADRGEAPV